MVVFMSLILICPDDENEGLRYQRQCFKRECFKKKNLDSEISPPAPITSRKTREKKKLNELQEAMAIHKHKNKIETEQVYLHGPNSVDMDLSSICHKRPKTVGSPKSRRYKSVSLAVAVRVYLLTPQL